MISLIKGKIVEVRDKEIVLLNNDIGYLINIGSNVSFSEGSEALIHTYMNVREDDISLWGFLSKEELEIFKLLLTVSGIGAKSASSLVYILGIKSIINSIYKKDYKSLKISGVGDKTAQKIVIELSEKIVKLGILKGSLGSENEETLTNEANIDKKILNEALEALEKLGYLRNEILNVINSLELTKELSAEGIIKEVLIKI